jgi:hypothetical protein
VQVGFENSDIQRTAVWQHAAWRGMIITGVILVREERYIQRDQP